MQLGSIRAHSIIVLRVCPRFVVGQLELPGELPIEVVNRSQRRWQLWWRRWSCLTRIWLCRSHWFWSLPLAPSCGICLWSLWRRCSHRPRAGGSVVGHIEIVDGSWGSRGCFDWRCGFGGTHLLCCWLCALDVDVCVAEWLSCPFPCGWLDGGGSRACCALCLLLAVFVEKSVGLGVGFELSREPKVDERRRRHGPQHVSGCCGDGRWWYGCSLRVLVEVERSAGAGRVAMASRTDLFTMGSRARAGQARPAGSGWASNSQSGA